MRHGVQYAELVVYKNEVVTIGAVRWRQHGEALDVLQVPYRRFALDQGNDDQAGQRFSGLADD